MTSVQPVGQRRQRLERRRRVGRKRVEGATARRSPGSPRIRISPSFGGSSATANAGPLSANSRQPTTPRKVRFLTQHSCSRLVRIDERTDK